MIFAKLLVTFLLALPGLIDAYDIDDQFVEDVYAEHNKIRERNQLPTLYVDKNLEEMMQRLGYNSKGHGHAQVDNLQSYGVRVTGTSFIPSYRENTARSFNYKHTMQTLFYKGRTPGGRPVKGWMESPGHKDAIIDPSLKYMGCAVGSTPSSIGSKRDYSYTCAFIRKYKDSCLILGSQEEVCDGSKPGLPCFTTRRRISPKC